MLSFRLPSVRSQSTAFAEKIPEDQTAAAHQHPSATAAQSTVTCGYLTHIAGFFRNVTVLWSRNLVNHSLTLMVPSLENNTNYCCKIDLVKPWQFWSKKGSKSFEVEGHIVEIYWDLRSAKFSANGSPEPISNYYVAIVSDEEVVLLLGDMKKKAYKRTKSMPTLIEGSMYLKKESIFGKKSFSTRARFDDRRKDHEVVVESSNVGAAAAKEPEMWISVDGIVVFHVKNLQWNFRGNLTVAVDKTPVQVYYDVHDWLFGSPGTASHGLFLFKPGAAAAAVEESSDAEGSGFGSSAASAIGGDSGGGSSPLSRYHSTSSGYGAVPDFCLFLYAWKLE